MQKEMTITLFFNLDRKGDRLIYNGIKRLAQNARDKRELSEMIIESIDNAILSLAECENRRESCERALVAIMEGVEKTVKE